MIGCWKFGWHAKVGSRRFAIFNEFIRAKGRSVFVSALKSAILTEWPAPKVQIKRQRVSLGWAYRIYIGGNYMGLNASFGAKRMLAIYLKQSRLTAP